MISVAMSITLKSHVYLTGISRGNKDQCMFLIYLEAISVSNNKGTKVCVIFFKLCGANGFNVTEQTSLISYFFWTGQPSKFRQGSGGAVDDHPGGDEFTLKELYAVQEIQSQPNLLRLIVK